MCEYKVKFYELCDMALIINADQLVFPIKRQMKQQQQQRKINISFTSRLSSIK